MVLNIGREVEKWVIENGMLEKTKVNTTSKKRMKEVRTAIVDSQVMFVEGLCHIIEQDIRTVRVVGKCHSASDIEVLMEEVEVELVIMDLNLDDKDSVKLIKELKKSNKDLRLLVLSSYSDWRYVKDAFMVGADGFIDKRANVDELREGIAQVLLGHRFLAEGLSITPSRVNQDNNQDNSQQKSQYHDKFMLKQSLTKREAEILVLITQAKSNKEIGEELFISDQTVGVHRRNIMRKLGVKNTVNLVKVAYEHQLV